MVNTILSGLLFVALIILLAYQHQKERDRESHEMWLSELRECLHCIKNEFSRSCKKITESAFSEYNERLNKMHSTVSDFARDFQIQALFDVVHKHNDSIDELKKQYKDELYYKITALNRITIGTIPEHIEREYEINISNIADTYRDFGNLMWNHLIEIR